MQKNGSLRKQSLSSLLDPLRPSPQKGLLACITGALEAKRGARGILHELVSRFAQNAAFASLGS